MENSMLNIKDSCIARKNKFKQQYNVTDGDLQCNDGRKEEMLANLLQKLGTTMEGLHEMISKL